MSKIKVSAVSYTNTKPFVYGLNHSGILDKIELSLDVPSDCATKLIEGRVDIGLVPVAVLPLIPRAQIISDYCIGANDAVNSVFLFSGKPIQQVKSYRPDSQSRTSNGLARILFKHHWNIQPEIKEEKADAFVEIGDRTFGKKHQYPFAYDLAEEWKKLTALPFVFATWTANKVLDPGFLKEFNESLKYGLAHTDVVIRGIEFSMDFDMEDYLTNKLNFDLDEEKRRGLEMYLRLLAELDIKAK